MFVKRTAHSLILSRARALKGCEMKRVREYSPETLLRTLIQRDEKFRCQTTELRFFFVLYFIFVLVGVSGNRRKGEGSNKLESKN